MWPRFLWETIESSDSVEDFHFKMSVFFMLTILMGVHNHESLYLSFCIVD